MQHGFLMAIVCCPVPVLPSEWLPGVWRTDEEPRFASTEQAGDITALIMRMHNDIASMFQAGEELGPLMLETTLASGETTFVAQGWCWGFMGGIRLKYEAWEPHLDAIDELLPPVAALADLGDDDSESNDLLNHPDKVEQLTDAIPESVLGIHRQSRSEASGSAETVPMAHGQGGAQRSLSMRQRNEVQEVLRSGGNPPLTRCQSSCPRSGTYGIKPSANAAC